MTGKVATPLPFVGMETADGALDGGWLGGSKITSCKISTPAVAGVTVAVLVISKQLFPSEVALRLS